MDPCTHKTGRTQLMSNNNSYDALFAFLPELAEDDQGLFKKWISLAAEEDMWNNYMSLLTDFQKCGIENVLQCICLAKTNVHVFFLSFNSLCPANGLS